MKRKILFLFMIAFIIVTVTTFRQERDKALAMGETSVITSCGNTLGLRNDGMVWACGRNDDAQLGLGNTTPKYSPVLVPNLNGVISIDTCNCNTIALKNDHTVRTWGDNQHGELGNGTFINSNTPVSVKNLNNINAVSAGGQFSVALRSDNTVWTWGTNFYGQLGNGTNTDSSIPTQVKLDPNLYPNTPYLSGIIAISAGTMSTLALRSDGTVWAWGENGYGELGNGSTTYSIYAVQVHNLSNITAIAAGGYFGMALKNDGTFYTWGQNNYGQLGIDPQTSYRSEPAPLSGISGIAAFSGGFEHVLALKTDGTVWAWGSNGNGQLGVSTSIRSRYTPAQVSGLPQINSVCAGWDVSYALKSDGTIYAWGSNNFSQLGIGSTADTYTPTLVSGLGTLAPPRNQFYSGSEDGDTPPSWSDTPGWYNNISNYACSIRQGTAQSGSKALMYQGTDNSTSASYIYFKVYDVNITVTANTYLNYWINPQQDLGRYAAVDLICTDGTTLRDSGAVDSNGLSMHPNTARGAVNTWTQINCRIGKWLNGKTIDVIYVAYDHYADTGSFQGYIDDISIYDTSPLYKVLGTLFGASPPYTPGCEYDKAFDGNDSTYYMFSSSGGGYTGVDAGAGNAYRIAQIRFLPLAGYEFFLPGGKFQGSNSSPTDGFTDLYTIPSNPPSGWNTIAINNSTPFRYLRFLSPPAGWGGKIAEVEFYTPDNPTSFLQLTGKPYGVGPASAQGREYDKAFDSLVSTFYDTASPNGGYTGIDLGEGNGRKLAKIRYFPRSSWESRMVGGMFQCANVENGYKWDISYIGATPPAGCWSEITIGTSAYRYFGYSAPNGGYGDVAELQFITGPTVIPGAIQVSDFDDGDEGVTYHDNDTINNGGLLRNTGVDIEYSSDSSGLYDVGWTKPGEWLNYTVQVASAGTYNIDFRVANTVTGGVFHLEDTGGINLTGPMNIPNTGGYQTYQTVTKTGVNLISGTHVLKLVMDSAPSGYYCGNFICMSFNRVGPYQIPGTIQAEDFDDGGEGVAYHDTDSNNIGGAYRNTGVDIQPCQDTGGGYNVGWTNPGEWMNYSVFINTSGYYNIGFRVAYGAVGGYFHLECDGNNITGSLPVPNTGGSQTYQTVTKTGVYLTYGPHVLKLYMDINTPSGGCGNFNYMSFTQ